MKKQLTLSAAEELCSFYLNKVNDSKLKSFLLVHSSNVSKTAGMLGKLQSLDINLLRIAGFVHDLGYSIEEENHAQHSLELLEQSGYDLTETLKDCILNHGAGFKPLTEEGKVFQIADKLSIVDFNILSVFLDNGSFSKEDIFALKEFIMKAFNSLDNL